MPKGASRDVRGDAPTAVRIAATGLVLLAACAAVSARDDELDLKSVDQKVLGSLNIAALNRLSGVALSGTPSKLGGFIYAFDRRLDTAYEAKTPGEAHLDLAFAKPQVLQSVRLLLGEGRVQWSVAMADTYLDLDAKKNTFKEIVPARERLGIGSWDEAKLPPVGPIKALRITLKPPLPSETVTLKECNLVGEQVLESVGVKSASGVIQIGRQTPLEAVGYFSGGETRVLKGAALKWQIVPERAARMVQHNRIVGLRISPIDVRVQVDKFVSPPYPLEVVTAD